MSVRQSKCARIAREVAQDPERLLISRTRALGNRFLWETVGYIVLQDAWEDYVRFVYSHACKDTVLGEAHHVFPKSVFPGLKSAPWNMVALEPEHHFQAHALLFDAIPSCPQVAGSFMMMGGQSGGLRLRPHQASTYAESKRSLANKLQVRDGDRVIYVDRDDPRVVSGELKHFNHGKVPTRLGENTPLCIGKVVIQNTSGQHIQVDAGDPRIGSEGYRSLNAGTVPVQDSEGNRFRIRTDDPRWVNGEVTHVNKGTVSVVDPVTGERFRVSSSDPRWLSGELTHANKGTVSVVDPATGIRSRCKVDDPRYLSGELVHQNKGKSFPHPEGFVHPNKGKIVAYTSSGARRVVSADHPDVVSGVLTTKPSKRRSRVS